MSSIHGEPTHAINERGSNRHLFVTHVGDEQCKSPQSVLDSMPNFSGYVYCISRQKGIVRRCPSDTVVSFEVGGCVNRTTNEIILPVGSRCASQPCQNGGTCFDFPSADAFFCLCPSSYEGVHCHARTRVCVDYICGPREFKRLFPTCISFASDRALRYICVCLHNGTSYYTSSDCWRDEPFHPKCDENVSSITAVPFTNKAYVVCLRGWPGPIIKSCRVGHVWNDTQKECASE